MLTINPFVLCTNSIPVKNPEVALSLAKELGFRNVEVGMIDGICEQFNADEVTPDYCASALRLFERKDLTCIAVSGHCDMTDSAQFARLLNKIRFAGEIGAKYLNTRCGPKTSYSIFLEHVKKAAELADSLGVNLNLESYGDIVGPASEAAPVFAELESLGINAHYTYDNGNTFRFKKGEIIIEEDIRKSTMPISYIHLKDQTLRDGIIYNTAIGAGDINISAMLDVVSERTPMLTLALETPTNFSVNTADLSFNFLKPTIEEACRVISESVKYLRTIADIRF